jgi:hypothetical protein
VDLKNLRARSLQRARGCLGTTGALAVSTIYRTFTNPVAASDIAALRASSPQHGVTRSFLSRV